MEGNMVTTCLRAPAATEPSAGPWSADPTSFRNGAVYITDADGELIGYATDTAGHTTEDAAPDRRTPAEILRNAKAMARAPAMQAVIQAFTQHAPAAFKQILDSGQAISPELQHAFASA
jgi:hypothetical protein